MTRTVESPVRPIGDSDLASSHRHALASATLATRTAKRVVYHAASVIACVALLILAIRSLPGRTIDLSVFILLLLIILALALLSWRLHTMWLYLDQPERFAGSHRRDPLLLVASLPFWRDRISGALYAAATATNVAIFGYVSDRYATLPPFLPLHYSARGDVDRLGTPPEVYMMPAIGLAVLIANLVLGALLYRRERCAVYLLGGATIFVQLVLFVATANVISRA